MTFNLVKDYVFPGFFLHLPLNSILCLLLLCTWFIETLFKWTFFASNLHWWKIPSKKKFSLWMDFIYLLWIALGLFLFFELQTDYFILSPATLGSCFKNNSSLTTTDWAPLKGHSQNCQVFLHWYQRVDHPLDTIGSITKKLPTVF